MSGTILYKLIGCVSILMLVVCGLLTYRTNVNYQNEVIRLNRVNPKIEIGGLLLDSASMEIIDAPGLSLQYPEAREAIFQDCYYEFEQCGRIPKFLFLSIRITNHSSEDIQIAKVFFPFGACSDAWYAGYDPFLVSRIENGNTIRPEEEVYIHIPVALSSLNIPGKMYEYPEIKEYRMVIRDLNGEKFYEFPVKCVGVIKSDESECEAFIKDLVQYGREH